MTAMTAKDPIRHELQSSQYVLGLLLADLTDEDILVRPAPGANHIAWQLGHLIASEHRFLCTLTGVTPPALPDGFAERHSSPASREETSQGFLRKAEYLELLTQVRRTTLAALDRLPEADLDRPNTGPLAPIAPTLGTLFQLMANHVMMHGGQFSVVRRALGKPHVM
jgi:hypothetical protein